LHQWGIPKLAGWFIENGKPQSKMDDENDEMGFSIPYFRKHPYII
jgi:hypothetical protein